NDPSLRSFRDAINAGVPFVMVASATYTKIDPARLAIFSPVVMGLLRSQLGFRGVIISDDLGEAAAVAAVPAGGRAGDFLSAGGGMVTSPTLPPPRTLAGPGLGRAHPGPPFRAPVDPRAGPV